MELIFIFAVILFEVFLIHLLQVVEIVRTFGVDTFMQDEMFPLFFRHKCFPTVRAAQSKLLCKAVLIRSKVCIADLAFELSCFSVIAVKIRLGSAAGRAGTFLRDVAFFTARDRFYFTMVPVFKVGDKKLPVPFMLDDLDFRKLVHFEFLIFRGMGIIKSPLLERNISADEVKQPAVLLVKILNNRE